MKFLIAGCGNMGGAIMQAALGKTLIQPNELVILEQRPNAFTHAFADLGAMVVEDAANLEGSFEILLLAVKPQDAATLFEQVRASFHPQGLIISIMAGVTLKRLQEAFPQAAIIRAMPNTPASIGEGMTAFVANARCTEVETELALSLFGACGSALHLDEEALIDSVTAVSGSGPAYLFYLAEAMEDAAMDMGFDVHQARLLVGQTLKGASLLLGSAGADPAVLRSQVTSKGGTTFAATTSFDDSGLKARIKKGMLAAQARSQELGG